MKANKRIRVDNSEQYEKRRWYPSDTKAMLLAMEDSGLINEDETEENNNEIMTMYL
jgi:hypothetical protein